MSIDYTEIMLSNFGKSVLLTLSVSPVLLAATQLKEVILHPLDTAVCDRTYQILASRGITLRVAGQRGNIKFEAFLASEPHERRQAYSPEALNYLNHQFIPELDSILEKYPVAGVFPNTNMIFDFTPAPKINSSFRNSPPDIIGSANVTIESPTYGSPVFHISPAETITVDQLRTINFHELGHWMHYASATQNGFPLAELKRNLEEAKDNLDKAIGPEAKKQRAEADVRYRLIRLATDREDELFADVYSMAVTNSAKIGNARDLSAMTFTDAFEQKMVVPPIGDPVIDYHSSMNSARSVIYRTFLENDWLRNTSEVSGQKQLFLKKLSRILAQQQKGQWEGAVEIMGKSNLSESNPLLGPGLMRSYQIQSGALADLSVITKMIQEEMLSPKVSREMTQVLRKLAVVLDDFTPDRPLNPESYPDPLQRKLATYLKGPGIIYRQGIAFQNLKTLAKEISHLPEPSKAN